MSTANPTVVSSDVYFVTLDLIQSIRSNNQHAFDVLLPRANICAMDYAAIHVAVQFQRTEMLRSLLDICKTNEWTVDSPQSLVWAIEQNNLHVASLLLPHLSESAIEYGLKSAQDPAIIDAVQEYLPTVSWNLVEHWCETNQLYGLNAFKDKMDARLIQKATTKALKIDNTPALELFLNHCNNTDDELSKILNRSVSSSVQTMQKVMQYCTKDLYYPALKKTISFNNPEHFNVLIEAHTYSDAEMLEAFELSTQRSNSAICLTLLDRYPVLAARSFEAMVCAVRNDDRDLFDRAFAQFDASDRSAIEHAQKASWAASVRNRPDYLSILSTKIDLNIALEKMQVHLNPLGHSHQDHQYDCLKDFLAQQQNDTIVKHIGDVGQSARRKM